MNDLFLHDALQSLGTRVVFDKEVVRNNDCLVNLEVMFTCIDIYYIHRQNHTT